MKTMLLAAQNSMSFFSLGLALDLCGWKRYCAGAALSFFQEDAKGAAALTCATAGMTIQSFVLFFISSLSSWRSSASQFATPIALARPDL